ncbi:MAG: tetratricopeptide repeat protein [Clostridia bacterium]|nr:tetratricopeptide repeat protein [Clostridia bacterium]
MKLFSIVAGVLLIFAVYKLTPAILKMVAVRALADGDNDKATSMYKKASQIFGGNNQYKTEYALVLMRLGEFKQAENVLNSIILDGKIPQKEKINAKTYRAMAYHKQGRTDEATEAMEELFETAKNTVVYGMLGYLKQLSGDAELEFCKEAYDYNSDDRDICDNMLVAYIRTGDFGNADKIAEALREKYPQFVEGFYHSALLELKKGDSQKAKEFLDRTSDCRRSMLTTVSEEEIEELRKEIENA